ncbi:MAG: hypothetical protein IPJ41_13035 [Phycisphaerales bacterium]|nr:hypothetical protein [Phycisphaerales bacterium]
MNAFRVVVVAAMLLGVGACASGPRGGGERAGTSRTAAAEQVAPASAGPGQAGPGQAGPEPAGPERASPEAWYEPEIRAFEAADRANPPGVHKVLFIGSSSIRMWKTLAEDMAPMPVLNRGFGGSKTQEVLAVFDRIVLPYRPSVIVYYCGDNDLGTDNHDSQSAADGFIAFDRLARAMSPEVQVFYIPIKASVARWGNWEAMRRANEIVRAYCEATPGATYLDTVTPTLGAEGKPDPTIFLGDGLHLNAKGYEIWTRVVRGPVLKAWEETGE